MIKNTDKVFVAGHKGLIGSAIVRKLKSKGYKNILTIDKKKLNFRFVVITLYEQLKRKYFGVCCINQYPQTKPKLVGLSFKKTHYH